MSRCDHNTYCEQCGDCIDCRDDDRLESLERELASANAACEAYRVGTARFAEALERSEARCKRTLGLLRSLKEACDRGEYEPWWDTEGRKLLDEARAALAPGGDAAAIEAQGSKLQKSLRAATDDMLKAAGVKLATEGDDKP